MLLICLFLSWTISLNALFCSALDYNHLDLFSRNTSYILMIDLLVPGFTLPSFSHHLKKKRWGESKLNWSGGAPLNKNGVRIEWIWKWVLPFVPFLLWDPQFVVYLQIKGAHFSFSHEGNQKIRKNVNLYNINDLKDKLPLDLVGLVSGLEW